MKDGNIDDMTRHKEEHLARVRSDAADRANIKAKLESCIDPFDPIEHSHSITNIVTGRIASEKVNAHKSLEIGREQMKKYAASWPDGFHSAIAKEVVTMAVSRNSIRVEGIEVCDATLIYSRALGLHSTRQINFSDILKHELAPMPTAMFDARGEMRIAKAKATMKKQLKVEISARLAPAPEATVVDGSAILWVVHWPNKGTVQDYVNNVTSYILGKARHSDVYLVFDRYHEYSMKSGTRLSRAYQHASRRHRLSLTTPLPPQKVALTVTDNKVQLMELICQHLTAVTQETALDHKLVITGKENTPVETYKGELRERDDLQTTHEEADVIMVQQVTKVTKEGTKSIRVICDDTDVFILLMYFFQRLELECSLTMESTGSERTLIDIGACVERHKAITPELPGAHALTGCDTVAQCFGIGKATAMKILKSGHSLQSLGEVHVSMEDIMTRATEFMAACYGSTKSNSMSDVRVDVWSRQMARGKVTAAPALEKLPPTTEAFEMNVRRAHIQTAIWKSACEAEPPKLDPTVYGWKRDDVSKSLEPVQLPTNVALAPQNVLEMIHCGCSSKKPCQTAQCRCNSARLPCTMFCKCHGESSCQNEKTLTGTSAEDDEADDVE